MYFLEIYVFLKTHDAEEIIRANQVLFLIYLSLGLQYILVGCSSFQILNHISFSFWHTFACLTSEQLFMGDSFFFL